MLTDYWSAMPVSRKAPYLVPSDPNEFGKRLRQLRLRAGLTQDELELASGVDQSTLSKWERGGVNEPSEDIVATLERFFGVPSGELMDLARRDEQRAIKEPPPPGSLVIPSPNRRLQITVETLTLLDDAELQRVHRMATMLANHRKVDADDEDHAKRA